MTQIIFLQDPWTRETVENDPEWMYLFTDNLNRTSGLNKVFCMNHYIMDYWKPGMTICYPKSSQAVIRGLANAYPITTTKDQFKGQLRNSDYDLMKSIWLQEFKKIQMSLPYYKGIKCSSRQFGNGTYSKMITEAPRLWELLSWFLWELGIDNRREKLNLAI